MRSDADLEARLVVAIVVMVVVSPFTIYSYVGEIRHKLSQNWVGTGCTVHGVWLDAHWRSSSCNHHYHGRRVLGAEGAGRLPGRHGCGSYYWQYHYEVSVIERPTWPRTVACYYESCRAAEENDEDDAALYLDRVLGKACERAGYDFDEGILDFGDTDPTDLALEHGLNCSTSQSSTQMPFSAAGSLQTNDARNVGGNCPYTDDEDCDEPIIGSGLCGQGTDAHDCAGIRRPGAALGGGQFRTGTPCQCDGLPPFRRGSGVYPCWYNAASDGTKPNVKMSGGHDPILGDVLLLILLGIAPACAGLVFICGVVCGVGPMSASAKFERQWSGARRTCCCKKKHQGYGYASQARTRAAQDTDSSNISPHHLMRSAALP